MEYIVVDEDGIQNNEFGYDLEPGFEFNGNEVEPDLLQNWLTYGRIAPVGAELPEPEEEVLEDDSE